MNTAQGHTREYLPASFLRMLILAPVMIFVFGCASSMEELFVEANQSGDWTAVNKRFDRQEAAREEQQTCGSRHTLHCKTILGETSCGCAPNAALWDRTEEVARQQRGNRH